MDWTNCQTIGKQIYIYIKKIMKKQKKIKHDPWLADALLSEIVKQM